MVGNSVWRGLRLSALAAVLGSLVACGGGSGSSSSGPVPVGSGSGGTGGATTGGTSSSTTTTTTASAEGTIALSLASQSISSGIPTTVTATLADGKGVAVPGAVVTFTTDPALGVFNPASGTALTDASGRASVQLSAASAAAAGAAMVTATAVVGSKAFSTSRGYSVGAASIALSTPVFGANPLSAFGNTSVAVSVTSNGQPLAGQLVTFTSPCASSGKAQLTSSVVSSSSGSVQATYQDKGCGTADTISASASGLATTSATLNVVAPSVGSVQYVSASPQSITLLGTGGFGRQETSTVTFKVVDAAGNPLGGKDVSFSLNTTVGGISLSAPTAKSDPTTGLVSVIVSAGSVATPVRVSATTTGPGGAQLVTQSDQLVISTGVPDQDSVSLSASTLNIEGWNHDGVQSSLTVRLADHFNNPVPDGTAVSFAGEGGSVQSSCQTQGGGCTVVLSSQNPRPANGRVTVMAYAIGEEAFTDLNGNGKADTGEYLDVGEAFRDDNRNGVRDAGETFIDFDNDGVYDPAAADSLYNGLLCATSCNPAKKSLHVWDDIEIVFSGSEAVVSMLPSSIDLGGGGCDTGAPGRVVSAAMVISDVNGNPMPAGTKIELSTTNGKLLSTTSFVQPNTSGGPTQFSVLVQNDAPTSASSGCVDPTPAGLLTVTVTTPKELKTVTQFSVIR